MRHEEQVRLRRREHTRRKRWGTAVMLSCIGGVLLVGLSAAHFISENPFAETPPLQWPGRKRSLYFRFYIEYSSYVRHNATHTPAQTLGESRRQ